MSDPCKHENVKPEVCDQTVGVVCCDCRILLGVCWRERHFSESLWNKACLNNPECIKCRFKRDDFCGLCGASMTDSPVDYPELVEDEDGAPLPEAVQKQCQAMRDEIHKLREELAEHEASFSLRSKADMRGIKMWQEAAPPGAPSRELIWPDHADLVVFLLERIDTLEKDRNGKRSQ